MPIILFSEDAEEFFQVSTGYISIYFKRLLVYEKFAKRAKIPVGNIKVLFHFHCDKQNWIPSTTIYKARCILFIQVNYKKSKIYQLIIVVACTKWTKCFINKNKT